MPRYKDLTLSHPSDAEILITGDSSSTDLSRVRIVKSNTNYLEPTIDANALYSSNIPKVWAHIVNNTSPSASSIEGFNVASVTFPNSITMRITFVVPFIDTNYAVTGASATDALAIPLVSSTSTNTYVDLVWRTVVTTPYDVDFTSFAAAYSVVIFGKQA